MLQSIRRAIPAPIKAGLRKLKSRAEMLGYDNSPVERPLTKYVVDGALVAEWSPDHQHPHGAVEDIHYLPHLLLAKAAVNACAPLSWCDLGTGVGSLPLAVARLGIDDVLAIDGTDAALRAGLVRLPSNYFIADLTKPIHVSVVDGLPAHFDLVSALELLEHIPDDGLTDLFRNIRKLEPRFLLFTIGLQPDPPYHVNLKRMSEWIELLWKAFPELVLDDPLSEKIFTMAKHPRFQNDYKTNFLPDARNLLVFVRR